MNAKSLGDAYSAESNGTAAFWEMVRVYIDMLDARKPGTAMARLDQRFHWLIVGRRENFDRIAVDIAHPAAHPQLARRAHCPIPIADALNPSCNHDTLCRHSDTQLTRRE